jgi:hypothetical protein
MNGRDWRGQRTMLRDLKIVAKQPVCVLPEKKVGAVVGLKWRALFELA